MPSLHRVRREWLQWARARPWPVWAAAGAVFVLFAALGAVTRGPAEAPAAVHSLADGVERGTGVSAAPQPSATPVAEQPRYPGVAYPPESARPAPSASTPTPSATSPYYPDCAAAEAAGAAPISRGRPGYRPELDRDGDGVACDVGGGASSSPTTAPAPPTSPAPTVSPSPSPTPTASPTPSPTPTPTSTDAAVNG